MRLGHAYLLTAQYTEALEHFAAAERIDGPSQDLHDAVERVKLEMRREGDQMKEDELTCALCLEDAVIPYRFPSCGHIFCYSCMLTLRQKWDPIRRATGEASRCPYCRANVYTYCPLLSSTVLRYYGARVSRHPMTDAVAWLHLGWGLEGGLSPTIRARFMLSTVHATQCTTTTLQVSDPAALALPLDKMSNGDIGIKVNALDCFRMALRINPMLPECWNMLGDMLLELCINKLCLDLVPQTLVAEMVSLGVCRGPKDMGNTDDAKSIYRLAGGVSETVAHWNDDRHTHRLLCQSPGGERRRQVTQARVEWARSIHVSCKNGHIQCQRESIHPHTMCCYGRHPTGDRPPRDRVLPITQNGVTVA